MPLFNNTGYLAKNLYISSIIASRGRKMKLRRKFESFLNRNFELPKVIAPEGILQEYVIVYATSGHGSEYCCNGSPEGCCKFTTC